MSIKGRTSACLINSSAQTHINHVRVYIFIYIPSFISDAAAAQTDAIRRRNAFHETGDGKVINITRTSAVCLIDSDRVVRSTVCVLAYLLFATYN